MGRGALQQRPNGQKLPCLFCQTLQAVAGPCNYHNQPPKTSTNRHVAKSRIRLAITGSQRTLVIFSERH